MKKIIIIASIILFILIVAIYLINIFLKKGQITPSQPLPTITENESNNDEYLSPTIDLSILKKINTLPLSSLSKIETAKEKLPYEDEDVTIKYSSVLNKIAVEKKTDKAQGKIDDWLKNNGIYDVVKDNNLIVYADKPIDEYIKEIEDAVIRSQEEARKKTEETLARGENIDETGGNTSESNGNSIETNGSMNKTTSEKTNKAQEGSSVSRKNSTKINESSGKTEENTTTDSGRLSTNLRKPYHEYNQLDALADIIKIFGDIDWKATLTPTASVATNRPSAGPAGAYVHYYQCDNNYRSYPLPAGCDLCYAGCGPTTTAMVLATLADSSINPISSVELYKKYEPNFGCKGTAIGTAKKIFEDHGLKTSDYLVYQREKSENVVTDLRNYLSAGWTIFMVGEYKETGGKHYIWITKVDENDNIWSYDSYYGYGKIPYNQNERYPYPLYTIGFAVKKI